MSTSTSRSPTAGSAASPAVIGLLYFSTKYAFTGRVDGESRAIVLLVVGVGMVAQLSRNSRTAGTNSRWYWKTPPCPESG
jgi:hypothetical protein